MSTKKQIVQKISEGGFSLKSLREALKNLEKEKQTRKEKIQ